MNGVKLKNKLLMLLFSFIFVISIFSGCAQSNGTVQTSTNTSNTNEQYFINSINHRGYYTAPENTLSAYKLSKEMGFTMVECDVTFTKDNIPVLLHDETIDRTSNGTGKISDLTFDEVRKFDFGSWEDTKYSGEKIPAFSEFIDLCRKLSLHPYIEIKPYSVSREQVEILHNIVHSYGMKDKVTWISFGDGILKIIKELNPTARLGYIMFEINKEVIERILPLKCNTNEVFLNCDYNHIDDEAIKLCRDNNLPIEAWVIDSEELILKLDPYITGVTSNCLIAGKILANSVQ